ncbi:HAD family hydrolase [Flavobacterium sp. NRK F10]|uniref:HAD family hydrolase n=1 Tax=Flavobacterium sp. NRK F10 TaxID=2954931 RepID=UPI0020903B89|nr:HAD family hydrolase [Flavobacterium sp. NRK F10]MCO6176332.1 HAD family hydrolase [Flavobacterium sp. NRK F10]
MMSLPQTLTADSLIFDLDGTLWDASESTAKAWNQALEEFGQKNHSINAEQVRSFSGQRVEIILKENFSFLTEKDIDLFFETYKKNEMIYLQKEGGSLFPDVKETLEQLKERYNLFIVSNCLSGYIENFLNFHELNHLFNDFECSGNTGQPKTYNIKQVIQRNQLKTPVYIGDTIWDFEAAQNNNIPFVYAQYGFGTIELPSFYIRQFRELLD